MSINVMLVDDHDIIRYALRSMLEQDNKQTIQIVAETDNGRDAVELARKHRPDLVVMDISLPELNGIEATRQIRQVCKNIKVIVLSMHNRKQYLRELLKVGISGYILKTSVSDDLSWAIKAAIEGRIYLSPKVAELMHEDYIKIVNHQEQSEASLLSPRQTEVLQLIVEGKSTKEIAAILRVSSKAVDSVRHRMMQKLDIDNVTDLIKYALKEGVTTLEF